MSERMTDKRRHLLEAARRDLAALRLEWARAHAQHGLQIDAQFKEAARRLRSQPPKTRGLPTTSQAEAILDVLGKARLKPAKGRAKDLRRVELLLDDVLQRMPPQE